MADSEVTTAIAEIIRQHRYSVTHGCEGCDWSFKLTRHDHDEHVASVLASVLQASFVVVPKGQLHQETQPAREVIASAICGYIGSELLGVSYDIGDPAASADGLRLLYRQKETLEKVARDAENIADYALSATCAAVSHPSITPSPDSYEDELCRDGRCTCSGQLLDHDRDEECHQNPGATSGPWRPTDSKEGE